MSDCYRETPRTARKRHTCCECMAAIDPGERYASIGVVWEGTAETFKLCAFCHALFGQIWRIPDWVPEDGPSFGSLCAWLHECFWRDDRDTSEILAGIFPLVETASLEHEALHYGGRAVSMRRGSRARGHYLGRRLAAQLRLRALRASRWTVAA